MSYAKTVVLAIGICFLALLVYSVVRAILQVRLRKATGFAISLSGIKEALLVSVLSGWVIGSAWYFLRRR